ncbi:MAG: hypothetical protein ACRD07_20710 [Acidimicrobiales bacterium]
MSLVEVLERHGDELHALPGVVGYAVGTSSSGAPVIHVYVESEAAAEQSGAGARALLAPAPVEVFTMSPPKAEAG